MPLVAYASLGAKKSIATATDTFLSGSDLVAPTGSVYGLRSGVVANSTLVVPWDDWYRVQFRGCFNNNSTGVRAAKITRNSTAVTTGSVGSDARAAPAAGGGEGSFDVDPLPMYLIAGDVLRFAVWQNSGAALDLNNTFFGGAVTGVSLEALGTVGAAWGTGT